MRVVAAVGLMTAALGVVVLLAQSLSEVLTDPTLSLEDGYLIGRLPWTAVGVDLVVFGSSAALVAGVGAAWPAGGGAPKGRGRPGVHGGPVLVDLRRGGAPVGRRL